MLRLFSPAKLNLFLHVLGQRADGYHTICSLFQAIDLGDTMTFSYCDHQDFLYCDNPDVPVDGSNTILRAIQLFREKTGCGAYLHVELEKRIPLQAGLGGGSSNAATTLWALNEMSGTPLSPSELSSLGLEIGSDVPFFLSGGTSLCAGRGEVVAEISHISRETCWIIKPSYGLSTAAVYAAYSSNLKKPGPLGLGRNSFLNISRTSGRCSSVRSVEVSRALVDYRYGGSPFEENPVQCDAISALGPFRVRLTNDLERAAFSLSPSIKELKERLREWGFSSVVMSGSGTSFFCMGKDAAPPWEDVASYHVSFLNRKGNLWYEQQVQAKPVGVKE